MSGGLPAGTAAATSDVITSEALTSRGVSAAAHLRRGCHIRFRSHVRFRSHLRGPDRERAGDRCEHFSPQTEPGGAAVHTGPAAEVAAGPVARPAVALTFHGGGDPKTATAILDICAQRGAHITVLAIGTWLQENPSMATAILAGGHDLGNHTWSHQVLSDLDQAGVREEITRCRDLLVQQTGSPGSFFRTSSGQHASQLILDEAGAAGYPVCLSYDVDPEDWTDPGASGPQRCGSRNRRVDRQPAFRAPGTVQALPGILDDFRPVVYRRSPRAHCSLPERPVMLATGTTSARDGTFTGS